MTSWTFLRQAIPVPLRRFIRKLRLKAAPNPVDDTVLADYLVVRDENKAPRLTFVIQYLSRGSDFGGAVTGVDLFSRCMQSIKALGNVDFRFIVTEAGAETDPSIITKWAAKAGLAVRPDQIEMLTGRTDRIAVRANEIFFVIIWHNARNFAAVRARQQELFDQPALPLIWLMQDYEPAFFSFSSAHLLSREAYAIPSLIAVINSGNLAKYLNFMGHKFEEEYTFEPLIVEELRPFLEKTGQSLRKKRIVIYGRPNIDRNCFNALIRGLRRWAKDYRQFDDWQVISAGNSHAAIPLGDDRKVESLGKLELNDYADVMLTSSVGISLMASPHPSYPPLEMAHFGLQTVTNTYPCKDWATYHPNIVAVQSIEEEILAEGIARACERAEYFTEAPANPDYVRTDPYPFLGQFSSSIWNRLAATKASN